MNSRTLNPEYDVALSFAGENRPYVEAVAHALRQKGVAVFYDRYEEGTMWGKNLYEHLQDVYFKKALYTVMFISKSYAEKIWTNHERQSAQARALEEKKEYVLPARFNDTEVPGLLPTISYINLKDRLPEELADLIFHKIRSSRQASQPSPGTEAYGELRLREPESVVVRVTVRSEGVPLAGVSIALVSKNGTYLSAVTNEQGIALCKVPEGRTLTIFCAHPNRPAYLYRDFDLTKDLDITLPSVNGSSSTICYNGTCSITGLGERLNPIRDSSSRLYVYAENIAIAGGQQQPVNFSLGVPFSLEDCHGRVVTAKILEVIGRTSLVEFNSSPLLSAPQKPSDSSKEKRLTSED